MKQVLIIENNTNPLSIQEFVTSSKKKSITLGGTFTEFDIENRNNRIYTAPKFLPALGELNERISGLGVYGELDHPDVFDTSISRSSHLVVEALYNKEKNRIDGKIRLLNTIWGKEAQSLVEDNAPVFVSSRAAGITENDGTVTLKKLFTYDIVADPGFASAKMGCINESLNYSNNANFRIYEMSDESKINDLFNMNKNDYVTREQLSSYSKYLKKEIENSKKTVNEAVSKGKMDPKELEKLLENQESMIDTNGQVVKYLDYLAETLQIVVNDNKNLREISEKLISHNDYIAENLENSMKYVNYVAGKVDESIEYVEYVAGKVDENIEQTVLLTESVERSIAYAEYIAEQLDRNIGYAEYIAEQVDNSIAYSEYLTEHIEGNIAYSQYIAENLDQTIGYAEYISENLDKNISLTGLVVENLNGNKLNEDLSNSIPTLEEWGFDVEEEDTIVSDEVLEEPTTDIETTIEEPIAATTDTIDVILSEPAAEETTTDSTIIEPLLASDPVIADNLTTTIADDTTITIEEPIIVDEIAIETSYMGESDSELSLQIDSLINEAKKRKTVETSDMHFLKFLNKSQVDSYYSLTNEEQEQVKIHIADKNYFTPVDVLKLIQESLSIKNESLENRVIRLMPDALKTNWEELNESGKKSILSQARLHSDNLINESAVENFWNTRSFKKNDVTKKMVSHDALIQEDKLSDDAMKLIMERINGLK